MHLETFSPPPAFTSKRQALCSLSWVTRPALRKRATLAVGHLVAHLLDDIFEDLLHKILNGLETSKNTPDRLRTYIQVTGAISRSNAPHFDKFRVAPSVIRYTELDDDELHKNALQSLEAFVLRHPMEITPHIGTVIDFGLKLLCYDLNYDEGDDGEDDEDETLECDNQDDDEGDDEGDYSDNDDMSWKVRRTSAKLLSTIIGTRQNLLEQLYTNVAPSPISCFKEREETVRVEIIQTFITLPRQTSAYGGADYDIDTSLEASPKGVKEAVLEHRSKDKFYKISSDALVCCMELIKVIHHMDFGEDRSRCTRQSHSIAVLCINSDKNMELTVSEYVRKLEDARSTDSLRYLSLVTLGDIGLRASLSGHDTLHTSILAMFKVHSEEVRSAAAYAIGNGTKVEGLVHIVVMEPFKHRLDDGQEIHKSAFEFTYMLLEKCRQPGGIDRPTRH
ncbi:Cullin-associated NEDD8-dissociated protein 1 [Mortierella sp. NVP85]|nr:Cullin-associated NEDD8-dissociated protein 1 [Mortierella sp. NVP85]